MSLEEVAQSHEGPDCLDVGGQFGILDGLELVFSRFDSLWSESESQVGHFLVAEETFVQIDFEVVGV